MRKVLVFLIATFVAASVQAQAHKCKGPDGKLVYSDQPCAEGYSGGQIRLKENSIDTSMDWERQERYIQKRQAERERERRPAGGMAVLGTSPGSEPDSSRTLEQRRRDCMVSAGSLRRSRTAAWREGNDHSVEDCLDPGGAAQRAAERATARESADLRRTEEARRIAQDEANRPSNHGRATMRTCDAGGCWGSDGDRYNISPDGKTFTNQKGPCRRVPQYGLPPHKLELDCF